MAYQKPIIIVERLNPRLARMPKLKFEARLELENGDPLISQGVTPEDALNQLLTGIGGMGWSISKDDYDIRTT
jgi:hypothetical protein